MKFLLSSNNWVKKIVRASVMWSECKPTFKLNWIPTFPADAQARSQGGTQKIPSLPY